MSSFYLLVKINSLLLKHVAQLDGQESKYQEANGSNEIGFMQSDATVADNALQRWDHRPAKDHHDQQGRSFTGVFTQTADAE